MVKWLVQRLLGNTPLLGSRVILSFLVLVGLGISTAYAYWVVICVCVGLGLEEDGKKRQATTHEPLLGSLVLPPQTPTFAARFG
ncbi:hypothetical protein [Hymenobacter rubidus]|uniref:hypothetical protein n=1 Tax=Hymenobacter rubidus TaxID=1441626 RepID=UPI00191F0373|nr:hypothetical protein [Hymenobacter rubidus]